VGIQQSAVAQTNGGVTRLVFGPGVSTLTIPPHVRKVTALVIGGGGDGGTTPGTSSRAGSGGGGSGAIGLGLYDVTPGEVITVTVGSAGGTSSFGARLSCTGGGAGVSSTSSSSAAGGSAGVVSGNVLLGQPGSVGSASAATAPSPGGAGAGRPTVGRIVSGSETIYTGSLFGMGGLGGNGGAIELDGGHASGFGAGGGGGGGNDSNNPNPTNQGGTGSDGLVIVEWVE